MTTNSDTAQMAGDGTAWAEIQCHCSEDDGVPDVGVSLGLGCGKAIWIGELLTRDGATCGMVFHDGTKRTVAPFADGTDWQAVADILRYHIAPALAALPPTGGSGCVVVPREVLPEMIGRLHLGDTASDGERLCSHSHPVPAGHPLYWPERMGEYPDDVDPLCLGHAIEQAENESGWCACAIAADFDDEDGTLSAAPQAAVDDGWREQ